MTNLAAMTTEERWQWIADREREIVELRMEADHQRIKYETFQSGINMIFQWHSMSMLGICYAALNQDFCKQKP